MFVKYVCLQMKRFKLVTVLGILLLVPIVYLMRDAEEACGAHLSFNRVLFSHPVVAAWDETGESEALFGLSHKPRKGGKSYTKNDSNETIFKETIFK